MKIEKVWREFFVLSQVESSMSAGARTFWMAMTSSGAGQIPYIYVYTYMQTLAQNRTAIIEISTCD